MNSFAHRFLSPLRVTAFATTALLVSGTCSALPSFSKSDKAQPACTEGTKKKASDLKGHGKAKLKNDWVSAAVVIKAPPAEVWRSIHEERAKDPDLAYSKVLEQISPTEYKLEQKFNFIPVIGSSVCVMHQKEVTNERIDYSLLQSDRFKAMEGSWVLTPTTDGKETRLELSSHLDMGIPVPRMFMNGVSTKKIQKRLDNVKHMAEQNYSRTVAAKDAKPAE